MSWDEYELGPTGLRPGDLREWISVGQGASVFTHRFHADLVEQQVVLPDGTETSFLRHADDRDGVRAGEGVGAICRREDGKILVAWQWNLGPRSVVAEFPGGGVNPGESPEAAIQRELAEESWIWPAVVTPIGTAMYDNRRSGLLFRWFLCTELRTQRLDGDEAEIATAWLTETEIENEIRSGRFTNQTMLAAWTLYRLYDQRL